MANKGKHEKTIDTIALHLQDTPQLTHWNMSFSCHTGLPEKVKNMTANMGSSSFWLYVSIAIHIILSIYVYICESISTLVFGSSYP